ncbi:MAG: uracil-DNA glycosylase [Desulfatiglandaceae bacterium]
MGTGRGVKAYPGIDKNPGAVIEYVKRRLEAGAVAGLGPPPLGARARGFLRASPGADVRREGDGKIPSEIAKPRVIDSGAKLDALRYELGDCRRCKLWRSRNKIVFGEGSPHARLVFVGEGPGRDEDHEGRPFVGEAGKMLTRIITKVMGLTRDDVYICNVVKCRPPGNRDPEADEIAACLPFLTAQLSAIGPEVICVLGRVAGSMLLGKGFKITRDRGQWFVYNGIPVMPIFHPAYILRAEGRQRELKMLVWEDVKQVMKRLGLKEK